MSSMIDISAAVSKGISLSWRNEWRNEQETTKGRCKIQLWTLPQEDVRQIEENLEFMKQSSDEVINHVKVVLSPPGWIRTILDFFGISWLYDYIPIFGSTVGSSALSSRYFGSFAKFSTCSVVAHWEENLGDEADDIIFPRVDCYQAFMNGGSFFPTWDEGTPKGNKWNKQDIGIIDNISPKQINIKAKQMFDNEDMHSAYVDNYMRFVNELIGRLPISQWAEGWTSAGT